MNYTPETGQSIFDVAIQFYGDISCVRLILDDNPDITINTDLTGISLKIRDDLQGDNRINVPLSNAFRRDNVQINNGFDAAIFGNYWITAINELWKTEKGESWQI